MLFPNFLVGFQPFVFTLSLLLALFSLVETFSLMYFHLCTYFGSGTWTLCLMEIFIIFWFCGVLISGAQHAFIQEAFGRSFSEELEKQAFTRSELNTRFEAQWRSA